MVELLISKWNPIQIYILRWSILNPASYSKWKSCVWQYIRLKFLKHPVKLDLCFSRKHSDFASLHYEQLVKKKKKETVTCYCYREVREVAGYFAVEKNDITHDWKISIDFSLSPRHYSIEIKAFQNLLQDRYFSLSLPVILNYLPQNYDSPNVMIKTYPHFELIHYWMV